MAKALTIHQPFAELIARGLKRVENRTWPTRHRGPLLIHAGKGRKRLEILDKVREVHGLTIPRHDLDFGAIVAEANLVACVHLHAAKHKEERERFPWLREHVHAEGPWCWILEDVRRLPEPIPMDGQQNLWTPSGVLDSVEEQHAAELSVARSLSESQRKLLWDVYCAEERGRDGIDWPALDGLGDVARLEELALIESVGGRAVLTRHGRSVAPVLRLG